MKTPSEPQRQPIRLWVASLLIVPVLLMGCSSPPHPDATGPELYSQLCSACHGPNLGGKVGPALGSGSPSSALPDEYLETSIRRGIGTMPSFDHLTEPQVARLVAYIRDIQNG